MSSFCARMGEDEPTDLYPGTYYLCLEQTRQEEGEKKKEKSSCQKSSVLRMKRPLDKTVPVRVVFVADPRRLKEPSHYIEKRHSEHLWKSMLVYVTSGCVDGYCLVPPQFEEKDCANYFLCAGRNDGLLMYIENHEFDPKKHIRLKDVEIGQVIPIEESEPTTTLLLKSDPEPTEFPKDGKCFIPLPNRFSPPWEESEEVRNHNWRCIRLLLTVHRTIPADHGNDSLILAREIERLSKELDEFKERRKREERERLLRKIERLRREEEFREREIEMREEEERERREKEGKKRREKEERERREKEERERREKEERERREKEEREERERVESQRLQKVIEEMEKEAKVGEELKKTTVQEIFKIVCEQNDIKKAQILLKITDFVNKPDFKDGMTSLHYAVRYGKEQMVEILLGGEATIDATNKKGETPLHIAVIDGLELKVKILLKGGANIEASDKNGFTPLLHASEKGKEKIVEILLDQQANINALSKAGYTPLRYAVWGQKERIVKILLNPGNIEALDKDGRTLLHDAAMYGLKSMVEILLERNANIEATTKVGFTPLHYAAWYEKEQIVQILLKKGANFTALTKKGETPLDIAVQRGFGKITEILKEKQGIKSGTIFVHFSW